ncbi:MAG: hypothetical protein ACI89X_004025 [Planctomycetota bacterium]
MFDLPVDVRGVRVVVVRLVLVLFGVRVVVAGVPTRRVMVLPLRASPFGRGW